MNFKNPRPGLGNPLTAQDITGNRKDLFPKVGWDAGGNNENIAGLRHLGAGQFQGAASHLGFGLAQQAGQQQDVMSLLQRLRNRNYAQQGQRANASVRANYGQAQGYADQSARAQGLGQGAQLGAQQGLSSQAARAGAAQQAYWEDPRRQDEDEMQAVQFLGQFMAQNPWLEQLLAGTGPIAGQAAQNEAARANRGIGGVARSLAPFVSMIGGGGMGGVGMGGGGADPSMYQPTGWRPGRFGG